MFCDKKVCAPAPNLLPIFGLYIYMYAGTTVPLPGGPPVNTNRGRGESLFGRSAWFIANAN